MATLAGQRCLLHPQREAAARCPECRRPYCRECVTEHDGRMLCASCIARLSLPRAPGRARSPGTLRAIGRAGRLTAGVLAAWLFFHALGETLALVPADTHDGAPPAAQPQ